MSSIKFMGCALAAVLLLSGSQLRAQVPEMEQVMRTEEVRLDSLTRAMDLLRQRMEAERPRRPRSREPLDSMTIGPFRVIGQSWSVRLARPWLESAWSENGGYFAGTSGVAEGKTIIVTYGFGDDRLDELKKLPDHYELHFSSAAAPSWQRMAAKGVLLRMLNTAVRGDYVTWLGERRVPADMTDAEVHRLLLLNGPSIGIQRCREKHAESCMMLLGLRDPGPRFEGWYTAEEMQRFQSRRGLPPAPIGEAVRAHFVTHVMRSHTDLLSRLSHDTTVALPDRIAQAAGEPIDTLVMRWQATVMNARRGRDAEQRSTQAAALLWVALFAAFATRSTRWRVG